MVGVSEPILACIITQCVFLKAGCATLKRKMCNIKLKEATQTIHHFVQKL